MWYDYSMKESHMETLSLVARWVAVAVVAAITLCVSVTSFVLGFTVPTYASIDTSIHHHCEEMDCEECYGIVYDKDCKTCNPVKSADNKGLAPGVIGAIGGVTALILGVPLVIFIAQRRDEFSEMLVENEQN